MLSIAITLVIACIAFGSDKTVARVPAKLSQQAEEFQPVALIELFTSQGCSSCPSADYLLMQTINAAKKEGRNIFALSFHVDYWNRLGWTDPFSTKEYSQRQNEYASELNLNSVYTPQMIVNGTSEFVGSDSKKLEAALNKSLNENPAAAFKALSASLQYNAAPKVKFALDGNFADCKINFALVSINETTSVNRGENDGLILTNQHVVRQFISIAATAEGEVSFKNRPIPSAGNMAIVAYIQHNGDLKIIGAAKAEIK